MEKSRFILYVGFYCISNILQTLWQQDRNYPYMVYVREFFLLCQLFFSMLKINDFKTRTTNSTYTSKTLDYLKAVELTCGTEERKFATKTTPRIHETPDSREIVLNHFTLCKTFASKRCWLNPLSWRYRAKIVSSPINATKNIRKPKIDPSGSNPAVLLMHGKNG